MKYERKFFRCGHCGNIISYVKSSGAAVVCCGEPMREIIANSTDAAGEKHIPVAKRTGNKLQVTVASVLHPMTPEHHIEWILAAQSDRTECVKLKPTGSPTAEFYVNDGKVTVYEYCNLHGLWVANL
jgi:superoxide reductase